MNQNELYHYGVLGMKWGVRKSVYKQNANNRLQMKAVKFDKKSAVYTKKSEKIHASKDLKRSNRTAIKFAKYAKKSAGMNKKALSTDNEFKRSIYEKKAAKLDYKSAKYKILGDRISKTSGYGVKAMKYSIKSDKFAKKAAKYRMKIANNQAYIAMTKRKINTLSGDDIAAAKTFIEKMNFV